MASFNFQMTPLPVGTWKQGQAGFVTGKLPRGDFEHRDLPLVLEIAA
jgi:hypothetical protein